VGRCEKVDQNRWLSLAVQGDTEGECTSYGVGANQLNLARQSAEKPGKDNEEESTVDGLALTHDGEIAGSLEP
jgi:hypothetical protein